MTVCAHCGATISQFAGHRKSEARSAGDAQSTVAYSEPVGAEDVEATPHGGTDAIVAARMTGLGSTTGPLEFGDYELLEEVARGGMGIVFKARQRGLDRVVALKMILAGQLASDAEVQRFHTEARAAANLHHPNIVAIHDVGVHDSRHFFSMDFVAGSSLTALVRVNPLPPERAARYVQRIAEAIHYAHGQGILHRDLKPSNVLLDDDDQPRITDFGLAKHLAHESGLTASGAILGTPSYMPPEQAQGLHDRVGPGSDIYGIGAMLYELITRRPPFRGESPVETLRQVLDSEPVLPSRLNPMVDRDLETICLKCLQKDPARRYASGQELADDLGRYLRGEPILARPVGNAERLWRWCRRNPRVATLAALVFLLLGTVAAGSFAAYLRIRHEQARAEKNSMLARDAVRDMLTRVADELLPDLPQNAQTEKTRLDLLNGALSYYQQFLEDNANDPAMHHEIASTLQRVGEIFRLLGDDQRAKESFHKSIRIYQDLMRKFPDGQEYVQGLAKVYNFLGELHRTAGQMERAEMSYQQAIELQRRLVAGAADSVAYHTELASSQNNLGILLKDSGRLDDSELEYDAAIATLTPWLDREPPNRDVLQGLARAHINHGVLLRSKHRSIEAERAFARGLELMNRLVQAFPSRTQYQLELAACYNNLGNLLVNDAARRATAVESYRRARDVLEKLAETSPTVPSYRRELANCCNNLATVLKLRAASPDAESRDLDEAAATWRRGCELAEALLNEKPELGDYHYLRGALLGNLGGLALDQNDSEQARPLLEQAVQHEKIALDSSPSNPTYRAFLRTDYARLARTFMGNGEHAKAVEIAQQLPDLFPDAWQEYQRAAKLIAQCVTLAEQDTTMSQEDRNRRSAFYAAEATRLFQDAVARGYRDWQDLKTNPAFEPLHAREDFRRIIKSLESKAPN